MKSLTRLFHRWTSHSKSRPPGAGTGCNNEFVATGEIRDEIVAESVMAVQEPVARGAAEGNNTVLKALQADKPDLARGLIAQGGDLRQRDDCGSVAIHYAAALGYIDVLEDLLRAGMDPWTRNHQGQTPLVYAMDHRQWQTARLLWQRHPQSMRSESRTGALMQLVEELCAIAVDSPWKAGEGESGFYQKDYSHHPRVVEIGVTLNDKGGIGRMRKAAQMVQEMLGQRAVGNLECAWDGIGDWMM